MGVNELWTVQYQAPAASSGLHNDVITHIGRGSSRREAQSARVRYLQCNEEPRISEEAPAGGGR
jgi:hypothetical protein